MNPSKAKGTAAETAVVRYLHANGFPLAERRALAGATDKGDILAAPGFIIEVKDQPSAFGPAGPQFQALLDWQEETFQERRNAHADKAWLVIKRPGTTCVDRWFCWECDPGGYWFMRTLADSVEIARNNGWGTPHDYTVHYHQATT